jgi:dethiobiotin synthetase
LIPVSRAIFITGTGTDVGKSAVALSVLLWGRARGLEAVYCKPIQCGEFPFGDPPSPHGDAEWVKALSPGNQAAHVIYRFRSPVSPHLAAEREHAAIDVERLRNEVEVLARACDLLVVEGAGGPAVPLDRKGTSLGALMGDLGWPSLVACAPGLGTLHHTLATLAYLDRLAAPVAGLAFCHRDPQAPELFEDNARTLGELTGLPCFGAVPYLPSLSTGGPLAPVDAGRMAAALSPALDAWWNKAGT